MDKLFTLSLRIRWNTFFANVIEANNITSNDCRFRTDETYKDGTELMTITSANKVIIDKIEELYSSYDINEPFLTTQEKEMKDIKEENLYLGQMVTDLELLMLEMQSKIVQVDMQSKETDQELGVQITDVDLSLLEHKLTDKS